MSSSKVLTFKNYTVGALPGKRSRSRNGCLLCKRSKVKCDENKPTCSRCQEKNFKCVYSHGGKRHTYLSDELSDDPNHNSIFSFSTNIISDNPSMLPNLLQNDEKLTMYFQYFIEVTSYMFFPSCTIMKNDSFRNPFTYLVTKIAMSDTSVLGVCISIAIAHKSHLMSEPRPFDLISKVFKLTNVPIEVDHFEMFLINDQSSNKNLDNMILVKLLLTSFELYDSKSENWKYHLKQARNLFYRVHLLENQTALFDTPHGLTKKINMIFNSDLKLLLVNLLGFHSVYSLLTCSLNYKSSNETYYYDSEKEYNHFGNFWKILTENDNNCFGKYSIFSHSNDHNIGHHLFIFDASYIPICHSVVNLIYKKNKIEKLKEETDEASALSSYQKVSDLFKENNIKIQKRYSRLVSDNLLNEEPINQDLLEFYLNLNEIFFHTFLIHVSRRLLNVPYSCNQLQQSCSEIIRLLKCSVSVDSVFETSIFSSLCLVAFESTDSNVVGYCRERITNHSIGFGRPIDCLREFWAHDEVAKCLEYTSKKAPWFQFFEEFQIETSLI